MSAKVKDKIGSSVVRKFLVEKLIGLTISVGGLAIGVVSSMSNRARLVVSARADLAESCPAIDGLVIFPTIGEKIFFVGTRAPNGEMAFVSDIHEYVERIPTEWLPSLNPYAETEAYVHEIFNNGDSVNVWRLEKRSTKDIVFLRDPSNERLNVAVYPNHCKQGRYYVQTPAVTTQGVQICMPKDLSIFINDDEN